MNTRRIGDLEVSAIGMGCMGLSHGYGKAPSRECSIAAIRVAFDRGCTFFDTAEVYGTQQFHFGHNEELVGEALEDVRDEAVIATKIHPTGWSRDTDVRAAVSEHLDASMRRLRTDFVDLYYLHRISEDVPVEAVAEAMGELVSEGRIGGWGLSQVSVETLAAAHAVQPVTAVQNIYSMAERDCEADIIPFCSEHGIGMVAFSPVASGLLAGKVTRDTEFGFDDVRKFVPQLSPENIDANRPLVDLVASVAESKGATMAQVALAWMLRVDPCVVPIPGSKNRERILENLDADSVVLTDGEFAELSAALDSIEVHGHRGHEETEQNGFLTRRR
ncbi:MAG: aldo/keto reductase [Thermoplasmata archaeon]|nr:aldo/keto reductase [Thermoplasmata archaeon]